MFVKIESDQKTLKVGIHSLV